LVQIFYHLSMDLSLFVPQYIFSFANNRHSVFKKLPAFFSIFFSSCDNTLHVSAGYHKKKRRKKMEQGFTLSKALGRRLCCTQKV